MTPLCVPSLNAQDRESWQNGETAPDCVTATSFLEAKSNICANFRV